MEDRSEQRSSERMMDLVPAGMHVVFCYVRTVQNDQINTRNPISLMTLASSDGTQRMRMHARTRAGTYPRALARNHLFKARKIVQL
jgi:hypothetical protein